VSVFDFVGTICECGDISKCFLWRHGVILVLPLGAYIISDTGVEKIGEW
jgi:hypothetical protein